MFLTRRTTAWSLLALFVLTATASAGSDIPGQPDTEHSNYGDMGKAKVYVQLSMSYFHDHFIIASFLTVMHPSY